MATKTSACKRSMIAKPISMLLIPRVHPCSTSDSFRAYSLEMSYSSEGQRWHRGMIVDAKPCQSTRIEFTILSADRHRHWHKHDGLTQVVESSARSWSCYDLTKGFTRSLGWAIAPFFFPPPLSLSLSLVGDETKYFFKNVRYKLLRKIKKIMHFIPKPYHFRHKSKLRHNLKF